MKATFRSYQLQFKKPVLTSRGSMTHKNGYYIMLEDMGIKGMGECSFIEGLSIDRLDTFEKQLTEVCRDIERISETYLAHGYLPAQLYRDYPALAFGLETALLDLLHGGQHRIIINSDFYEGNHAIPINGLVWMGNDEFMQQQIKEKLAEGFHCIKIKVGAIDFKEECRLIENIRKSYSPSQIEIRLDANGAFTEKNVKDRLRILSQYTIHSIEQPVKPQQYLLMHQLCRENIIPIALDEELIGSYHDDFHNGLPDSMRYKLLETIRPQYIILKPSLLGGLTVCDEWINIASNLGIRWWATSALESNIGLNAIAQWAASKMKQEELNTVQGLGTGSLYVNNIASPLYIDSGHLKYDQKLKWADLY